MYQPSQLRTTTLPVRNSISRWPLRPSFWLVAIATFALSWTAEANPPTPTPTPTPTGTVLRFDGIDDFVDLGAGPSFGAHTIEAWVSLSAAPVSDNRNIVGPQGADAIGECFTGANLNLVGGLDGQRFSYNVGRRGCRNDSAIITDPVTTGVWHHLAGTWDGSAMRFYLDGNLVGTQSVSVFDPFDRMLIGAYWDHYYETPVGFFPGEIKEIRLWDHARTECEIREAACRILSGSEPGLIGYWLLDEGAGQTVFDSSPNGVNGTLGLNADPVGDSGDPEWVPSEPNDCPALCPTYSAQVQPPINADGTSVFSAKRGVVPVKFSLTQNGTSTCTLPPATIAVTRTAGGTTGVVNESLYSTSADLGSNFRIDACQYIYNLGSSALGAGTYRVDIMIGGQVVGSAIFQLK